MADMFMKVDGIPGESTDDKHKEWIEIDSCQQGVSQAVSSSRSTSGAASAGRAAHSDVVVTKSYDKASIPLDFACCNGTHIKTVEISLCRATGQKTEYLNYLLEDVLISSINMSSGGSGIPLESIAFNYGKIRWTYNTTDHKTGKGGGKIEAEWSTITNSGK